MRCNNCLQVDMYPGELTRCIPQLKKGGAGGGDTRLRRVSSIGQGGKSAGLYTDRWPKKSRAGPKAEGRRGQAKRILAIGLGQG